MGTTLHTLKGPHGATKKRKRVGRGPGSGRGEQSTRGVKGQKARSGHHGARFGFEGGQMPMQRRLPKVGFKNPFRTEYFGINVGDISARFESGPVTVADLKAAGLVPRTSENVKVLGTGDVTKKLTVTATAFSKAAAEKLAKAGGSADATGLRAVAPVKRPKSKSKSKAK